MSSNDDQPVAMPIRYAVHTHDLDEPFEVECDDVNDDGQFIRFNDHLVPVAVIPTAQLIAFHRIGAAL